MSAYIVAIPKPKCIYCHKMATVEVFNRFNAWCGYFCNRHGEEERNRLDAAHLDRIGTENA